MGGPGLGAFTTERRAASPGGIRVSRVGDLADASLSFQSIAQWDDAGYLEQLVALGARVWRDRAYGDMWAYMLLAEGLVDIVAEFDVKQWDLAALIPIVEEAGGRFTSVTGEPGAAHGSALATNTLLHDAVIAELTSRAASAPVDDPAATVAELGT